MLVVARRAFCWVQAMRGAQRELRGCAGWRSMEHTLKFSDDQIVKLYGFQHELLNTTVV
jgi:AMMECR1 domain-containing protein